MIYSMTAYARLEKTEDWGNSSWEIRSVNQRYLECQVRLPEAFRSLEPVVRDKVRQRLHRGKLEINLRVKDSDANETAFTINQQVVSQLVQASQAIQQQVGGGEIQIVDLLRWPNVISAPEQDMERMNQNLLAYFDELLDGFIESRSREGAAIEQMLLKRLDAIAEQTEYVIAQMPKVMQWQQEKITQRFEELQQDLEPARIEQEIVLMLQKLDVAEEMDRLQAHVDETRRILKKGGACGRRLDFMMQEFNRESNTLASKSIHQDITKAAVEMKVLIEQMREQIQNLE